MAAYVDDNVDLFPFVLIRRVIGRKKSRHFVIISGVKLIVTRSCAFSRSPLQLHVFATRFHWFTELSLFFVIGRNDDKSNQVKLISI